MSYRYHFIPLVLVLGFLLGSLEGVHAEGVMNVVMFVGLGCLLWFILLSEGACCGMSGHFSYSSIS